MLQIDSSSLMSRDSVRFGQAGARLVLGDGVGFEALGICTLPKASFMH